MEIALLQFLALIHNPMPLLITAFPLRDQGSVTTHQRMQSTSSPSCA